MTEKKTTPFYNLPLYDDGDSANLRDQYNNAITKVDKILHQINTKINTLHTITD